MTLLSSTAFYLLIGELPLVQARAQLLLPANAKRYWIETDADWHALYPILTQTNLFESFSYIDIRYYQKKLDKQGEIFFKHLLQLENLTTCMICQAPFLQLSPTFHAVLKQSQKAQLIHFKPLKGKKFIDYIRQTLQSKGFIFENNIPTDIACLTESNLLAVEQCMMHLALLHDKTSLLTRTHLKTFLTDSAHFPLHTLNQACLNGNKQRTLRIFNQFQQTAVEPILVLWTLTQLMRQLRALHQQVPYQHLSIWPDQMHSYQQALKRLSYSHITTLLQEAHALDRIIKSTVTPYPWDKLERLALQFCI